MDTRDCSWEPVHRLEGCEHMCESEVVGAVLALGILDLDLGDLVLVALDLLDPAMCSQPHKV